MNKTGNGKGTENSTNMFHMFWVKVIRIMLSSQAEGFSWLHILPPPSLNCCFVCYYQSKMVQKVENVSLYQ